MQNRNRLRLDNGSNKPDGNIPFYPFVYCFTIAATTFSAATTAAGSGHFPHFAPVLPVLEGKPGCIRCNVKVGGNIVQAGCAVLLQVVADFPEHHGGLSQFQLQVGRWFPAFVACDMEGINRKSERPPDQGNP